MGFEVQMSEFTDFERRPEVNTFNACFEAIRRSDYYLLLIGGRPGQWYDEANRVSVTMQEYRTALDSFTAAGAPKIVATVRAAVLTILREQRNGALVAGQGDDWQFIQRFVSEVRRENYVADGEPRLQDANWLSSFRDFRELTNVVRSTFGIKGPLPRVALLEALRHECEYNLRQTMTNYRGRPFYSHLWLDRLRTQVTVTANQLEDLNQTVRLTFKQMQDLIIHVVTGFFNQEDLLTTVSTQVLSSGTLLDFDSEHGRYVASPLMESLHKVRDEISLYDRRLALVRDAQAEYSQAWATARATRGPVAIRAWLLFYAYSVHDNQHNIVRLLLAILRHLYGHTSDIEVQLRPASPVEQFAQELEGHQVTEEQLEGWLRDDELLLRVGAADTTEEQRRQQEETEAALRQILGEERFEEWKERTISELLGEGLDENRLRPT